MYNVYNYVQNIVLKLLKLHKTDMLKIHGCHVGTIQNTIPQLFDGWQGPWLGLDTTLRVSCLVVHYLALMHPPLWPHAKGFLFCHVGPVPPHRQPELPVN